MNVKEFFTKILRRFKKPKNGVCAPTTYPTSQHFFREVLPQKIKGNRAQHTEMAGKALRFQLTGDNGGSWTVNFKSHPPAVTQDGNVQWDCSITCAVEDFNRIISGKLSAQMAFMTGKMKIAGDLGLAMKLCKLLT